MSDQHNLPINVDTEREVGTITYANEVIAIIAGMAMNEVEGVVGTPAASGGIADLFARKPATRGVKVEVGTEETSVDLVISVEYGKPIQRVATDVQENVRKAIETMTGLHVIKVDVHVSGISFEKEKEEMQEGYVKATATANSEREAEEDNPPGSADVDSPPEGIDPDELPIRNIHMNDGRTDDEAEADSATFSSDEAPEDEGK